MTALVPVPEAAMNKDHELPAGKHDIGAAGKIIALQRETKAEPMQERSDAFLRVRIASLDATHVPASLLRR